MKGIRLRGRSKALGQPPVPEVACAGIFVASELFERLSAGATLVWCLGTLVGASVVVCLSFGAIGGSCLADSGRLFRSTRRCGRGTDSHRHPVLVVPSLVCKDPHARLALLWLRPGPNRHQGPRRRWYRTLCRDGLRQPTPKKRYSFCSCN